jgi:competence protein ComEC
MRIIAVVILSFLLVACGEMETSTEEQFLVHAFKTGKADSFLIQQNDEYVLIDTAEEDDGDDIVQYLKAQNITSLKALIITHFDKDHVGGADTIVKDIAIEHIYVPNYESDSKQTKEFLQAVNEASIPLEKLTMNTPITIGSAQGTIFPPLSMNYSGDNDYSLVVSLQFGATSFLFAGDVEETRIADLLADSTIDLKHTFLKVPHHGRFNEQTTALFEAVQPNYALITSSDKNPEADETVKALKNVGATVYTTRSGDVEFISDGSSILVNNE